MGKGDEKRNQRRIDEQDARNQAREDQTFDADVGRRDDLWRRENAQNDELWADNAEGGSRYIDNDARDRSRGYIDDGLGSIGSGRTRWENRQGAGGSGGGGGGGGGGGSAAAGGDGYGHYSDVNSKFNDWSNSGGVDMGALTESLGGLRKLSDFNADYTGQGIGNIRNNARQLTKMGEDGGIDADSMGRFRGGGVYDEFSRTGGISDSDRANLRHRGMSSIDASQQNTQRELDQLRSLQGGYSPGIAASMGAAGRRTSQDKSDAVRENELGILGLTNQGRQWGAEGMSRAEAAAQGLRTGNMIQGAQSAGNLSLGLEKGMSDAAIGGAGVRQNALMGIGSTNYGAQALRQGGRQYGISGMERMAGERTRADEAAAAQSAAASRAAAGDEWNRFKYFDQSDRDDRRFYSGGGVDNEQYWGNQYASGQHTADQNRLGLHDSTVNQGIGAAGRANAGAGMYGGLGNITVDQDERSSRIAGAGDTARDWINTGIGGAGAVLGGLADFKDPGRDEPAPGPAPGPGYGRSTPPRTWQDYMNRGIRG